MKAKLTLSMDEYKVKELKKKAIDAGITLSDLLAVAGTITSTSEIKKSLKYSGGAAIPGEKYE